jgi:hypothetical protein
MNASWVSEWKNQLDLPKNPKAFSLGEYLILLLIILIRLLLIRKQHDAFLSTYAREQINCSLR